MNQSTQQPYPFLVSQSPMAGCTDLAFRLVARRRGMPFCFLEMISANGLLHGGRSTREYLKTVEEDSPLGVQLVGCDPDIMAEAAKILEGLGFKFLDINFGCPVRKVVSPGGGAALLKSPRAAGKIMKAVVDAVKIPVTMKTRKGFEDESGEEGVVLAKCAQDSGIKAVTIHGRTRIQGYAGKADWASIKKVKQNVEIPVIGNGDIWSGEDAKKCIEATGCDGVMVGRGGLGNPWIYQDIQSVMDKQKTFSPPTAQEKYETAIEHFLLEIEFEGEERAIPRFRRIGSWYIQGLPRASYWRNKLTRCHEAQAVKTILQDAILSSDAVEFGNPKPETTSSPNVSVGDPGL